MMFYRYSLKEDYSKCRLVEIPENRLDSYRLYGTKTDIFSTSLEAEIHANVLRLTYLRRFSPKSYEAIRLSKWLEPYTTTYPQIFI